MKLSLFAVASSLAFASAVPSASNKNSCDGVSQLATFDDLAAVPALAEVNPAGVAGVLATGVLPKSGSNVGVTAITNTVATGSPAFIPADGYKTLDLKSLYFGCAANTLESATGIPSSCTVAFTAYLPGSQVAYQTINQQFDPDNAVRSNMAKATFPESWIKMGKIQISIVESETTSALTALLIDNVSYDVYKC